MKLYLSLVIIFSPISHAGWFSNLCARHLIADDPAPYAEIDTNQLLEIYRIYGSGKQLDELLYRYRVGMMNHRQVVAFRSELTHRN